VYLEEAFQCSVVIRTEYVLERKSLGQLKSLDKDLLMSGTLIYIILKINY